MNSCIRVCCILLCVYTVALPMCRSSASEAGSTGAVPPKLDGPADAPRQTGAEQAPAPSGSQESARTALEAAEAALRAAQNAQQAALAARQEAEAALRSVKAKLGDAGTFESPQKIPTFAAVAAAAPADDPILPPNSDKPKLGDVSDPGILLELDECVEIAIMNNLNLQISRLNDRVTDYTLRIAWARFFPTFNESILYSNSQDVGGRNGTGHGVTTITSGVTQQSPWGTTLNFAFDETRRNLSQASRGFNANVSQPLWKGAGTDANLAEIRTARINRLISRASLDQSTQRLIFQVRQNYANVIRLLQQREVDRQALKSALTFLELTKARERAGQETRLDVYQAEVQLRTRELALVSDERQIESAYDTLKQTMDIDLEERMRVRAEAVDFGEKPSKDKTYEVLETDDAKGIVYLVKRQGTEKPRSNDDKQLGEPRILFQAQHFNEPQILADAMSNRIDLLNSRRGLAVQQLQTMLAKNGLGYQVDLVGSYGHTFTDSSLRGGVGSSDNNAWTVGLNASIPWGKIADKSNYEVALLDLQRTEIQLKGVRTTVHADVRDVLRTLREAEKTLLIEALRVEQAKRTLEATRISFERGLKSSFDVVTAEDVLLSAKNDFISFRLAYVVDLANLELIIGKATGRVDMEGQTLGGQIEAKLPETLSLKQQPKRAPDADPSCEDHPLNNSARYRCDPKPEPDTRLLLVPLREPPCNCEIIPIKP